MLFSREMQELSSKGTVGSQSKHYCKPFSEKTGQQIIQVTTFFEEMAYTINESNCLQ